MKHKSLRSGLLATTTIAGAVLSAMAAMPTTVLAQDTAAASDTTTVVVTGSIIKKKNFQSISPLTVLSAADLEKRGVTTVEAAVQNVAGNNGGAISNNWSAAGNFAAGASGLSLRGLTSNSTLVLVDGMRMTYYPLADDATRNFVDLNTIPSATIDHVDVLQDGASSTYGSDAIAGVVNVVTKKSYKGLSVNAEAGAPTGHDGAGVKHIAGIWGMGDLAEDGYNLYVSAEYQKDDILLAKDADFPYNTADFSSICAQSEKPGATASAGAIDASGKTCITNCIFNGLQFDGRFAAIGTTTVPMVREFNAAGTAAIPGAAYRLLNTAAGCRG
ncbi:MAG: TonB-dependent receptor plug domain-containing protein, partial [Asticcacaulis sp.]|nr:TonB-dependent receptor plug domain-containing protein [Asticcacaulis sp.]